ncbi:helix-turn-helix transcriptional regulator [Nonomuraea sp. NPDC049637]|uniref:helix-turn-helix domain-containing protein n=1 Tax=Nonomuraea sp. NPDC049637 TaxID=3154356 RepID=UPI0034266A80
MDTRPDQPAEGRLIEEARERLNISQNKAAKRAGMSGTRWRQIVYGSASGGPGITNPVVGNPTTIASMAHAVDLTPDELAQAGRDDAASELRAILREKTTSVAAHQELDPHLLRLLELWPRMSERQRGAMVTMVEDVLGLDETVESPGRPEEVRQRRTG